MNSQQVGPEAFRERNSSSQNQGHRAVVALSQMRNEKELLQQVTVELVEGQVI